MKKAVIKAGSRQYFVSEGDILDVDLISDGKKSIEFEALLIIDDAKTEIGTPLVSGSKVTAEVTESEVKQPKVTSIRYKAKKRVRKVHGHRQKATQIKILKIK